MRGKAKRIGNLSKGSRWRRTCLLREYSIRGPFEQNEDVVKKTTVARAVERIMASVDRALAATPPSTEPNRFATERANLPWPTLLPS
jgi:hypothetical protein